MDTRVVFDLDAVVNAAETLMETRRGKAAETSQWLRAGIEARGGGDARSGNRNNDAAKPQGREVR